MATASVWAHNMSVTIGGSAVGGLTAITFPDQSRGEVEITSNDSGGNREFKPGFRDGGTFGLSGRVLVGDAGQDALQANYQANPANGVAGTVQVVVTYPGEIAATTMSVTFDAFVTVPPTVIDDVDLTGDEAFSWSASLKVTGEVPDPVVAP